MQALGLIEVIGYPPAVEAADAALKAANVTLLSIAKADAGIMTVEIIGDVGAVTSAVDAGASSAARIGIVRARHVIPRVESDLIGKVIPREKTVINEDTLNSSDSIRTSYSNGIQDDVSLNKSMEDARSDQDNKTNLDMETEIKQSDEKDQEDLADKPSQTENQNEDNKEQQINNEQENSRVETTFYTVDQLNKRSNANLKALIKSKGISITDKRLNEMKKQELIRLILENQ